MQNHFRNPTWDIQQTFRWIGWKGKHIYGPKFRLEESDKELILALAIYFARDRVRAEQMNIDLEKGILLTGPIGAGKSSLMNIFRFYNTRNPRYVLKSTRDVSFEFIENGFETIQKYSKNSFHRGVDMIRHPLVYCFDDLGLEQNMNYFGNETNVMAEILLSRYDLYVHEGLFTHLTTNLNSSEIEKIYGNRIRSRMREMFNLFSFPHDVRDKRK